MYIFTENGKCLSKNPQNLNIHLDCGLLLRFKFQQ